MLRTTLYSLLLCGFCLATSCNTPPASGTTETTTDRAETTTPATPSAGGETGMSTSGQNYTVTTIDTTIKSPRKELKGTVDGVPVTINYGSPAVNERTIYGDLVPYGKVWRTGANEATRITFDQPVLVGTEKKPLPAGTYSLFTLPADKDNWTVIFNKTADQWGAYDYAEADDVVRVTGTAEATSAPAERMDFALDGNKVELMWADLQVGFPVAAGAK